MSDEHQHGDDNADRLDPEHPTYPLTQAEHDAMPGPGDDPEEEEGLITESEVHKFMHDQMTDFLLPGLDASFQGLEPPWDGQLSQAPQVMALRYDADLGFNSLGEHVMLTGAEPLFTLPAGVPDSLALQALAVHIARERLKGNTSPFSQSLGIVFAAEFAPCDDPCAGICDTGHSDVDTRQFWAVDQYGSTFRLSHRRDDDTVQITSSLMTVDREFGGPLMPYLIRLAGTLYAPPEGLRVFLRQCEETAAKVGDILLKQSLEALGAQMHGLN